MLAQAVKLGRKDVTAAACKSERWKSIQIRRTRAYQDTLCFVVGKYSITGQAAPSLRRFPIRTYYSCVC